MRVADAIKHLSELPQEREIVLAWWEPDTFNMRYGEDWSKAVDKIEEEMCWGNTHDRMQELIDDEL